MRTYSSHARTVVRFITDVVKRLLFVFLFKPNAVSGVDGIELIHEKKKKNRSRMQTEREFPWIFAEKKKGELQKILT